MDVLIFLIQWYSFIAWKFMNNNAKAKFRDVEKIEKKLVTLKLHLQFNEICLKENLLPVYTNLTLHDAAAREEPFVMDCRQNLVQRQIMQQKSEIEALQESHRVCFAELKTAIGNDFKFDAVKKFLKRTVENHWSQLSSKHDRKLFNLYGGQVLKKRNHQSSRQLSRSRTRRRDAKNIFLRNELPFKNKKR